MFPVPQQPQKAVLCGGLHFKGEEVKAKETLSDTQGTTPSKSEGH